MTLTALNLQQPSRVAEELERVNRRLAREEDVPESLVQYVFDLSQQIATADSDTLPASDPYIWIELQKAALHALTAAHSDDVLRQRGQLRIALEQLRFLFARLAERQHVGDDRPVNEVARWLDEVLPVPQRRKAELFGVGPRTYQRWVSTTSPTRPESSDERAIRLAARIANQLRHSLGGAGVVDWLEQERDELGGMRAIDALRDSGATDRVLALAVSTRSSAMA